MVAVQWDCTSKFLEKICAVCTVQYILWYSIIVSALSGGVAYVKLSRKENDHTYTTSIDH